MKTYELDIGWLNALKDKRIGKALALLHENPGSDWSLASLAKSVNMSRTAFAQLFKKLVGATPIEYLSVYNGQKIMSNGIETKMIKISKGKPMRQ